MARGSGTSPPSELLEPGAVLGHPEGRVCVFPFLFFLWPEFDDFSLML